VAFPFMPMTDEMLKKLSRVSQDSDQTINSSELYTVFVSCEFKLVLELNLQHSETNQSNLLTNNR